MTLQPPDAVNISMGLTDNLRENQNCPQLSSASLPPVVCVASNDSIWANLLAQNLTARGVTTIQCDLCSLHLQIPLIDDGSWVVIDSGWPMVELQEAIEDLNAALRRSRVKSVMVVDDLVGPHPLASFKPDRVLNRTPDMRVLVRELISVFSSPSPVQPGRAD